MYPRFRDWAKAGVWKRMFDAVSNEPDMEYVMVGTIVKVCLPRTGRKRGTRKPDCQPLENGMTTKILAAYRRARQSRALRAAARRRRSRSVSCTAYRRGWPSVAPVTNKAFGNNTNHRRPRRTRRRVVALPGIRGAQNLSPSARGNVLQMAASGRKPSYLRLRTRIQADRHACRQN